MNIIDHVQADITADETETYALDRRDSLLLMKEQQQELMERLNYILLDEPVSPPSCSILTTSLFNFERRHSV
jgi:hypothetical protein